ncbi:MAG TPA: hypothetical protein VN132_03015, partial [Bdellovibrio sp.]|nr:hypothetical protein [Bdellovibrio sp.]
RDGKTLLLSFENARAELNGRVLFAPEWGVFDMAVGSSVTSVFGGAADREAYGETEDFVAKRVPTPKYSAKELKMQQQYGELRVLREKKIAGSELENKLQNLFAIHDKEFENDWLLRLEGLELIHARAPQSSLNTKLEKDLEVLSQRDEKTKNLIQDGLALADQLS